MLTTCYLFLGGAGGGALVALSVLEAVRSLRARRERLGEKAGRSRFWALPDEAFARAWPLCVVVLAVGILCLFADLGRPDRVLNLVTSPSASPVAVGAWSLVVALACALAFAAFALLDGIRVSPAVRGILAFVGVAAGVATVAYTGILLQGTASVLAWQTWLLPALFVLSSLSCGIAVVLLGTAFVEARHPFVRPAMRLANVDGVVVVAEALCLAAYVVWMHMSDGTLAAAQALMEGDLSGWFWGLLVTLGLAVPFVLERFLTWGNLRSQLLWIALFLLVGGFVLRYCVVGIAAYDVTQMPQALYGLALAG